MYTDIHCVLLLSHAGTWHLDLLCSLSAGLTAYNTTALGLHCSSSARPEQLGSIAEATASLLANTADCLAQSWLLSRQPSKGGAQPAAGASASDSSVLLLVQHQQRLIAAVQQYVAWPDLQRHRPQQAAPTPSSCSSVCDVSTITQLAQKLQAAAISVSSALTAVDGGGNGLDVDMAAGLWLQAVTCRCAAAVRTLSVSSSGSTNDSEDSIAAAAAAATGLVLQAVKPCISLACKRVKQEAAAAAASEAGLPADAGELLAAVHPSLCISQIAHSNQPHVVATSQMPVFGCPCCTSPAGFV